jgi:hypothetical protein
VVVLLRTVRPVISASVARSDEKKPLVEVLFVVWRLVMVPVVASIVVAVSAVAEAVFKVVCPVTVREEAVVVAKVTNPLAVRPVVEAFVSVVCPVTVSVPCEVKEEVAVTDPPVMVPPVSVVKKAVTPLSKVAKRLDEVAFVLVSEVMIPFVAPRLVVKRFVEVALVVVLLRTVRPVISASVARSDEKKPLVEVLFVVWRLVAASVLVTVAFWKVADCA